MRKNSYLVLAVALALSAWGCDNNDGTDAGPMGTDAGPMGTDAGTDAGPGMTDAGTDGGTMEDAGPGPTFQIRLANNLPGLTGTTEAPGGFHVCLWFSSAAGIVPGSTQFLTQSVGPVPFRGVSPPLTFPVIAPLDYIVALYEPANLGDPAGCPDDPNASGAPAAAVIQNLVPADVPEDGFISGIVTGLLPDTFGATGGALPSVCNTAAAAPTFDQLCDTPARIVVIQDDRSAPAAGMARFRVSNMIANSTPPSGFTVCYDPGLVPNPSGDGSCVDTTPSPMTDQETLAASVAYGSVNDYSDRGALVPTGVPAADVGGGIYIQVTSPAGCDFTMVPGAGCYPLLSGSMIPVMDPPLPGNVRFELTADTLNTIFISGTIGLDSSTGFNPSFFIWQDDM